MLEKLRFKIKIKETDALSDNNHLNNLIKACQTNKLLNKEGIDKEIDKNRTELYLSYVDGTFDNVNNEAAFENSLVTEDFWGPKNPKMRILNSLKRE